MEEHGMSQKDDLQALLERPSYIPDEGFTERVVRALPAQRRVDVPRGPASRHTAIVLGSATAACAAAYAFSGEALGRAAAAAFRATAAPAAMLVALALLTLAAVVGVVLEE
jgi:hypothetical protein